MNTHDYIEDYLNGELTGDALGAFEQALQNDPELRQAVERHRDMIGRLRALRLRETVKKNLVSPRAGGAMSASVNRRFLAAAAAIVLLAAATYFWVTLTPGPQPPSVADNPATPPDSPAVQEKPRVAEQPAPPDTGQRTPTPPRNDSETLTADRSVRIAFAETVRGLENIDYGVMGETQKDSLLENKLNTAIKYLKAGKPSRAIPLLENVLAQNNSLYQEDAEWLLALAWLPRDPARGKEQLKSIGQNSAHAYRVKALRLLNRFE